MFGYAIVKLEADSAAMEDNILQNFNDYMQSRAHFPSFVEQSDGYFRIEYNDSLPAASAGVTTVCGFLVHCGYAINGISTGKTLEGNEGTLVQFMGKGGRKESVVVTTLNVY
jgi:hypothetical protein